VLLAVAPPNSSIVPPLLTVVWLAVPPDNTHRAVLDGKARQRISARDFERAARGDRGRARNGAAQKLQRTAAIDNGLAAVPPDAPQV
jgi:hypothetical protein